MRLVKNFIPTLLVSVFLCGCNEYSELEDTLSSIADLEDSLSDNSDTAGLSAFNLTNIRAGTTDVKQMTLTWTSASDDSGVAYFVCQKDTTASYYDCNDLKLVNDALTATINVDSLIEAASAEYFILATNGIEIEISNENALAADTVTQMIGYVKASNTGSQDFFGYSVALSGDGKTLAVGAYSEDNSATGVITDGSETDEVDTVEDSGAVYLFSYDGDHWEQTAYLKASNASTGDYFGYSVSLNHDGSTLAVGAHLEDTTEDDSGAVYLFSHESGGWEQIAHLKASNAGLEDYFGRHLALSADGTALAVGAHGEDNLSSTIIYGDSDIGDTTTKNNVGAVYLFRYSDSSWSQTAYIKSSNSANGDWFGRSVALSEDGSTLAVGAIQEDNNLKGVINGTEFTDNSDATSSGAVYVFSFSNTNNNWTQTAYVKASNTNAYVEAGNRDLYDHFGRHLALSSDGKTLAVGARNENNTAKGVITDGSEINDIGTETQVGAVYLFGYEDEGWLQTAYVKASNSGKDDFFGHRVALSSDGSTLAVAAYRDENMATGVITDGSEVNDTDTQQAVGAVTMYSKSSGNWEQIAYVKGSTTTHDDHYGHSLALSGDGNTLVVGSYRDDGDFSGVISDGSEIDDTSNATNSGAVYIY
ncbi:hypothetical protein ACXJY6_00420 [Vibrio sp. RC27]